MKPEIVKILSKNGRCTEDQLAKMTGKSVEEVKSEISGFEKEGIIRGYKAVVDWEKMEGAYVSAIVELKVVPKADLGFEEVAQKVAAYEEVESVYLMSGSYDLCVMVKGKTLQHVANFVSKELATLESVTGTATHFVMRRYKELDVILCEEETDDREKFLL